MKYMGSKNRIAKHILPIMLKYRTPEMTWVEPFVGGANMIDKVEGKRIGADFNKYLIALFTALQNEWTPPNFIEKAKHKDIVNNKSNYKPELVGWASIACSYSGSGCGFAGIVKTKIGTIRNYQTEAIDNINKQLPKIKEVQFVNCSYADLDIPPNSLIYCDPPYENTSGYKNVNSFDHDAFWQWCRDKVNEGHIIFVSEYNAPNDFYCIWEGEFKSSLSANGKSGGNKNSTERLFTPITAIADKERGLF